MLSLYGDDYSFEHQHFQGPLQITEELNCISWIILCIDMFFCFFSWCFFGQLFPGPNGTYWGVVQISLQCNDHRLKDICIGHLGAFSGGNCALFGCTQDGTMKNAIRLKRKNMVNRLLIHWRGKSQNGLPAQINEPGRITWYWFDIAELPGSSEQCPESIDGPWCWKVRTQLFLICYGITNAGSSDPYRNPYQRSSRRGWRWFSGGHLANPKIHAARWGCHNPPICNWKLPIFTAPSALKACFYFRCSWVFHFFTTLLSWWGMIQALEDLEEDPTQKPCYSPSNAIAWPPRNKDQPGCQLSTGQAEWSEQKIDTRIDGYLLDLFK